MTIEVRQMLIRSTVTGQTGQTGRSTQPDNVPQAAVERLRADVLADCKAWLEDRLQQARER